MKVCGIKEFAAPRYPDNHARVADELRYLDLLIRRRILRMRLERREMPPAASAHPLFVSFEEVNWLLDFDISTTGNREEIKNLDNKLRNLRCAIDDGTAESSARGVEFPLDRLSRLLGLSEVERQALVISIAPELNRKYDRLYAYLQDDIARKKPSIDLVLDLLCGNNDERWTSVALFSGSGRLFCESILKTLDDPHNPSGSSSLTRFLGADRRIVDYILGNNGIDSRLTGSSEIVDHIVSLHDIHVDPVVKSETGNFVRNYFAAGDECQKGLILHFHGPYGAGRRELATGICGLMKRPMLAVDMDLLPVDESGRNEILRLVYREALLLGAAVYLANADILCAENKNAGVFLKKLARLTGESGALTIMAGEKPLPLKGCIGKVEFHSFAVPFPDSNLAAAVWEKELGNAPEKDIRSWAAELAGSFRLTPGRIRDAAGTASRRSMMSGKSGEPALPDIFAACRLQSNDRLGELAMRITPRASWEDLVLPAARIEQLREICCQVRHRRRVYGEWGFGRKMSRGKGLSVLFYGPSGTGKTMAAEVISHDLGLDMYKVDLSSVVSKYIGETEKNLARLFHEAETGNAIIFFDEADAVFGKRTEVSDAHDRYANIETSYLLQRMEEYEGVVILASNLRENMDSAFTRRIRFMIEFTFPDEESRLRIWRNHFPDEAPAGKDLDFELLGKHLQVSGGTIRNIALNAAFLAAGNNDEIGMAHLARAARNEYEKIGKLWTGNILPVADGPEERKR